MESFHEFFVFQFALVKPGIKVLNGWRWGVEVGGGGWRWGVEWEVEVGGGGGGWEGVEVRERRREGTGRGESKRDNRHID